MAMDHTQANSSEDWTEWTASPFEVNLRDLEFQSSCPNVALRKGRARLQVALGQLAPLLAVLPKYLPQCDPPSSLP